MLARIAQELFWLGRNVARAEHTARMLDGVFQASLQGRPDDPSGVRLGWGSILAIMGAQAGEPARSAATRCSTRMTLDARASRRRSSRASRGRARARARSAT